MGKALRELARMRRTWDRRPEVIRAARAEGEQWDDIAAALGLSRSLVIQLSKRVDSERSEE